MLEQAAEHIKCIENLILPLKVQRYDKGTITSASSYAGSTSASLQGLFDVCIGTLGASFLWASYYIGEAWWNGKINTRSWDRVEDHPLRVIIQGGAYGTILTLVVIGRQVEAFQKRTEIHHLKGLIRIAERFEELSKIYNISLHFCIGNAEVENNQLFEKIKHERYALQTPSSSFLNTPEVHALACEIHQDRDLLALVFAAIGEMDVYYTFAEKIAMTIDVENSFCCADFLDIARPTIQAKQFWNVLVNKELKGKVVVNNIVENRSIILTGPNEGGKTTGIRAILQNVLLAQTFGVAAATEFNVTPFDVIHSYLNISDDIVHGKSRFACEVERAQAILEKIESLESDEKFFFVLDELFTGTNAQDGETCAYNFMENILSFENVQFIYATHFHEIRSLEQINPFCINYKVDAPVQTRNGSFDYPYTLSLGTSDFCIGVEKARQAGLFKKQ